MRKACLGGGGTSWTKRKMSQCSVGGLDLYGMYSSLGVPYIEPTGQQVYTSCKERE